MSATATAIRPPSPAATVSAFAASLPADLSHTPILGILAVVMGAGTVTIAGRLLTLGLADLKGNVGISFDQGAWVGSAFNVAIMFIGPLTVYLGALLGARRVLLTCAALFALVSVFLPLVHSYSLLIALLTIAGLTSGTFYPLTLTFALRNIPIRYTAFGVALYATCIEEGLNFAPSLYGFFQEQLSWKWMFWACAVITPLMMLCAYFGIPAPPKTAAPHKAPSFVGFLYTSLGLALVYAAVDQGQRLDWWCSGLFIGLLVGGIVFLACSLVRRMRSPNPLIDLPYLRKWNTILLAVGLFFFRFSLLATAVVIPLSLSVRGFLPTQYSPAILWTALPELILAAVAAYFLNKGMDSRLLMGIGFACIAFACLLNAQFTSAWAAENYFPTELLMAVGQSFAFLGLVTSLVLQALLSGGMELPQRVLTFSAFFHTIRLFGGELGGVLMGHFIAQREKLHSNLLGLQVQKGEWITDGTVHGLTAGLSAKSAGLATAAGRAVDIVDAKVRLQAYALTFIDAFHLIAWGCVAVLLLTALLRKSPLSFGDLSAMQPVSKPAPGAKT
jgi:MFS transporter, DHA2 family, multidrug resistance protein